MVQLQIVQLQNLAHTTESLQKTVPFYRDVLGLPVNGARDPLAQQPQKLDEDMSKFTATKGMSFRAATFGIPNAAIGFELTEFTGGPRKAVKPNLQDIGAATLALQVRDIDKVLRESKSLRRGHRDNRRSTHKSVRKSEQQASRDRGSRSRRLLC